MFYNLVCAAYRFYLNYLRGWVVTGRENVPAAGPLIVVANHTSYSDPPILGAALTRQVHFMAKEELFRYPVFGTILYWLKAFPVKRKVVDRSAIRKALSVLEQEEVLGMFPEGTRIKTGQLGVAQPGVALLASRSGAPILPVGISRVAGKLIVKIGKTFTLKVEGRDREAAGEEIMAEIASLLVK
ncbi:MAG: 1-acyl-sn-glycerol-3-phosphate acyltransferase [Firmicutes bacterium]|nr:1-acyl-sn-glycerol-3-phosphate acyltransferase [Bacillota bacterium]